MPILTNFSDDFIKSIVSSTSSYDAKMKMLYSHGG